MKNKIQILRISSLISCLLFGLSASFLFAHVVPVHRQITINAVESVIEQSGSYNSFISTIGGPVPLSINGGRPLTPLLWMAYGSEREDAPVPGIPLDDGGKRSLNHFYDPLALAGLGLSDRPFGFPPGQLGQNSFFWGSTLKAPGYDVSIFGLLKNIGTINDWSWQDARNYEWLGLTSADKVGRDRNLAQMFRAVGQVMHLLEDTSQPQHVRNEQHADTPLLAFFYESPIEKYGGKNVLTLSYTHGILDWRAGGFTKLKDFWDRDFYTGASAQPLIDSEDPGQPTKKLGLAEWCNGNFVGDRHTYAELMGTSSPFRYPFPSLYGGTDFNQLRQNPSLYGKPTSLGIVGAGLRYIVAKTGQGVQVTHHAAVNYLVAANPDVPLSPGVYSASVDDPDVLKDYHDILIPEAIKYSAGLLDYFFRGTLDVTFVGQSSLKIKNKSGQDFKDGSFHLFYDDANGTRTEITDFSTTYTGALSSGSSISGSFTAPAGVSKYILVYQGTIGTTQGQASDPVDAGVAIATKSFSPPITVKISLYGQVILPNYYPDETFAYADLALYADTVELTDLHIVSDDYYDPDNCFYYGINCDTCGVASGYPSSANVEMECGDTYDFILQGNACDVTGAFSQVPAGYMLEWQTPSGLVEDNKTSQEIYSQKGADNDFKVSLKPIRILFTRDSLPPDGVDQTQATLTFLTGSSGNWFTGNPQWSISGDALGCTIDPYTGWIRAGTETGEITVMATDSGSTGHSLTGTLKIESSGAY